MRAWGLGLGAWACLSLLVITSIAAQATRGKAVFEAKCTACHESSRFTGESFYESFNNKPLKDLWDIASGTMPEDNPGSLKQQEYGDIIAYFLSLNEFKQRYEQHFGPL